MARRWYLWPFSLVLGIYFTGGLGWCLYKGFWTGAAFTSAVIVAHVYLFVIPSRGAWQAHRASRRAST